MADLAEVVLMDYVLVRRVSEKRIGRRWARRSGQGAVNLGKQGMASHNNGQ